MPDSSFDTTVNECKPSSPFSWSLFTSLVKREWQDQAKQILKSESPNAEQANNLLRVAPILEIEDKDVEPHLFTRLANVEFLACINQNQSISARSPELREKVDIADDEVLIWVFDEVLKVEAHRVTTTDKQWTVFQSILSNLFNKSRYKQFNEEVEDTGQLAITNQALHYVTKKGLTKIKFEDIYSTTPLKDGVRIQATKRDATPNTYITGDGRFTYTLLQYAADQKV